MQLGRIIAARGGSKPGSTMEGKSIGETHGLRPSDFRSTEPIPFHTSNKLAPLWRLRDLDALANGLAELLRTALHGPESVVVVSDPTSGHLRFDTLYSSSPYAGILSSWLQVHFESQPPLMQRLLQGEEIPTTIDRAGTNSQFRGIRVHTTLFPVFDQRKLVAVFGVVSTAEQPEPAASAMRTVRRLAIETAPIIGNMLQFEWLKQEIRRL